VIARFSEIHFKTLRWEFSISRLITIILLCSISQLSYSQCRNTTIFPVLDESSVSSKIIISGAVNNNLAVDNSICKVEIKFTHEAIGDIEMFLVSPSGQRLQLIGQSVQTSQPTNSSNWSVSFIPCTELAVPDNQIPSVWDNSTFGVGRNYTGSYYPSDGCLEDFNTGPVNGTWALIVNDVSQLDIGNIESFSITFCNNQVNNCSPCNPPVYNQTKQNVLGCKGEDLNNTEFVTTVISGTENLPRYGKDYVVFKGNQYVGLYSDRITTLDTGKYQFCATSYSLLDKNRYSIPGISNVNILRDRLEENGVCATIGNCTNVEIRPVTDTFTRNVNLCFGDSLVAYGTTIKREGTFFLLSKSGKCDSVLKYVVDFINIKPTFSPANPQISCTVKKLFLDVTYQEPKQGSYKWWTINGNIISKTDERFIEVDRQGKYYVEITVGECKLIDSVNVTEALDIPRITFIGPKSLNCTNPQLSINAQSSKPIATIKWGANPTLGPSINITSAGVYNITVVDVNGCEKEDSIVVISNFDKPKLNVSFNNLSCLKPTSVVSLIDSSNIKSITWLNSQIVSKNSISQTILDSGIYKISLIGNNGCLDTLTINISGNNKPLNPILKGDTILTCKSPGVDLSVANPPDLAMYQWRGPNGIFDTTAIFRINNPGNYSLTLIDTGGCIGTLRQIISLDTLRPFIAVPNYTIDCNQDSLFVKPDSIIKSFTYSWLGRDLSSRDTFAIVSKAGLYTVTVSDRNGCTNSTSFVVTNSLNHPTVSFTFDSITCNKDKATIFPFGSITGIEFKWKSGAFVGDSTSSSVFVTEGGSVVLEIKDTSGCETEYLFDIQDVRKRPVVTKNTSLLNCINDSVKLDLVLDLPMKSTIWKGPLGYQSDTLTPFVNKEGWYYLTLEDSLGCVFNDSIFIDKKIDLPNIALPLLPSINCNPIGKNIRFTSSDSLKSISWTQAGQLLSDSTLANIKKPGQVKIKIVNKFDCELDTTIILRADTTKPTGVILSNDHTIDCIKKTTNLDVIINEQLAFSQWKGPKIVNQASGKATVEMAGVYTLVMRDTSFCTDSIKIQVVDLSQFAKAKSISSPVTCDDGGKVFITSDIPFVSVVWDRPLTKFNDTTYLANNLTGTFRYTGTTLGNCVTTGSVDVSADKIEPSLILTKDTLTCDKPIANIGVTLNRDYRSISWSNLPDTTLKISVSNVGTYKVTVTNKNGCNKSDSIQVISNFNKPLLTFLSDTLTCGKSKLDLGVTTQSMLKSTAWVRPDGSKANGTVIKIDEPGTYKVTATGVNGCITNDSVRILQNIEKPILSIKDTFFIPCDLSPINISVDTHFVQNNILWAGVDKPFISRNPIARVNQLVKLYVYVTGPNGCQSLDSTQIVLDTILPKFAVINDTIKCNPDFAQIATSNFSNVKSFQWFNDMRVEQSKDSIFSVKSPGTYKVIVKGNNACLDSANFIVIKDTLAPKIKIESRDSFLCDNKEITLYGTINNVRPVNFNWSTTNGKIETSFGANIRISQSGTYKFQAKDIFSNCVVDTSMTLTYKPVSLISFTASPKDLDCNNKKDGSIAISGIQNSIGNVLTQINSKAYTNKLVYRDLSEGSYKISIKDSLGCIAERSILILDGESAELDLMPKDTLIDLGDSVSMNYTLLPANSVTKSYWIINKDTVCRNCTNFVPKLNESAEIKLLLIDQFGCIYQDSAIIEVNTNPFILLPNIIKVGSVENGLYSIPEYSSIDKIIELSIYDVWGNRVYHLQNSAPDDQVGWNGFYNGSAVNPGVFVVHITIQLTDGRIKNLYRDLTVVR
jgi:subtilisin-like proprotein convertase family protein